MRLLTIGGTWFVGRHITEQAQARGWDVTTFTRRSELAGVAAIHGDRTNPADLQRLAAAGPWDAVVDTSGFVPRNVRDVTRALRRAADSYLYLSSVNVYPAWPGEPVDEQSVTYDGHPELDGDGEPDDAPTYGKFKRGAEIAVLDAFPLRSVTFRPGVIIGPWEYVGRLPYWLNRAARGGRILAPGDPERAIQPVDARDLATFALDTLADARPGIYNVTAPRGHTTMRRLLEACIAATAPARNRPAELEWVDGDWLIGQGVREWTELPLWREAPGTWAVDSSRAQRAGLDCRPISETVADTWRWLSEGGRAVEHKRMAEHGLTPDREAEVLAAWDRRGRLAVASG